MKALSIKQPWASLIAHGIKDIENRTWRTNFRGKIYIHASSKSAGVFIDVLNSEQFEKWIEFLNALSKVPNTSLSAIIGEVEIVDCVINHESIWAEQTEIIGKTIEGDPLYKTKPIWNWVLANPKLYDQPILNVKGKLSFGNLIFAYKRVNLVKNLAILNQWLLMMTLIGFVLNVGKNYFL